jgi:hypothetical protein
MSCNDASNMSAMRYQVFRVLVGLLVSRVGPFAVSDEVVATLDLEAVTEPSTKRGMRVVYTTVHDANLDTLPKNTRGVQLADAS